MITEQAERLSPAEIDRLVGMLKGLRANGLHALRSWMDATEQRLGGRLVLQAPSKTSGNGHLPEAAFQSQYWGTLIGTDRPL